MWSWGNNNFGQLGTNNTTQYESPVQVGVLTTWSTVSGGGTSCFAIKTDGTMWSWGRNQAGQLGLGNSGSYTYRSSPVQIGALTTWATVAAAQNGAGALAIKTNGTIWSWGAGYSGQLGLGNTTNYSTPKQIGALTTWSKVYAGGRHCLAIKTDGTLWTWGYNTNGELGLGNTTNYSSPKQIGALTTWSKASAGSGSGSSFAISTP
jgi:alpha-tubulin suppressor-like RCC1 family protein